MPISVSNRNQPIIIELRGQPQKRRAIRGVSAVTLGSKNERTPMPVVFRRCYFKFGSGEPSAAVLKCDSTGVSLSATGGE